MSSSARPSWLNTAEYPFSPNYINLDEGKMHYVDEGEGFPIVMVHGTPTWSYLFRNQIKSLSSQYRVVAPDHLGFGLSDKPESAPYRPRDHARHLQALIDRLDLDEYVLVTHDFGGPIGHACAIEAPEKVRAMVLFNTWMWSLEDDTTVQRIDRVLNMWGGRVGRFLYKRLNFSPKMLVKAAFGKSEKLTKELHNHYINPFPSYSDRQGPFEMALSLRGESEWYDELWSKRDCLRDKPALLLWGMQDPTFGEAELERWTECLSNAEVETFPDAGHFVQEEEQEVATARINDFLKAHVQAAEV